MNKFRKSILASALMAAGISTAYAASTTNNNFTMLSSGGGFVGDDNFVSFTWDGTYNTAGSATVNATLAPGAGMTFFGYAWTAHDVKILAPGTHNIGGYTLTVNSGQVGLHMLFDWGTTPNISVVEICRPGTFSTTGGTVWSCASVDGNSDGIEGIPMAAGPFQDFNANFSVNGLSAYQAPTMPPTVSPANTASGVALTANIQVTFNRPVKASTVTGASFSLYDDTAAASVAGSVSCTTAAGELTASACVFNPTADLTVNHTYTATLTTAIRDAAGVALSSGYSWSFDTNGGVADVTPPQVSSVAPVNGSTSLAVNGTFSVTFDEPMDPAAVITAFTVTASGGASVAGSVSTTDNLTFEFTPSAALGYSTAYTATISVAATDVAGNALAAPYSWSATTVANTAVSSSIMGESSSAGGGCAYNPTGNDTGLLAALLASLGYIGWRRRQE